MQYAKLEISNPDYLRLTHHRALFLPKLTASKILELAQVLPDLWIKQNNFEKRKLVDLIYSNCKLDGKTLCASYRKPFRFLAEGGQSKKAGRQRFEPVPYS